MENEERTLKIRECLKAIEPNKKYIGFVCTIFYENSDGKESSSTSADACPRQLQRSVLATYLLPIWDNAINDSADRVKKLKEVIEGEEK
jgi:hypothetical protein